MRSGNTRVLQGCYDYLAMVTNYVVKNSGTEEDAQDVFQDALVVFYKNIVKPEFVLSAKVSTYLFAICRRLWLNKIRNNRVMIANREIEDVDERLVVDFDFHLNDQPTDKVAQMIELLDSIGDNCREILHSFYFSKLSLEEIALKLDYSNEQVARQQKYRCMQRMRKLMMDRNAIENQG